MSTYRAGDIIRWVFTNLRNEIVERSEHLLVVSNHQPIGCFICIELESGRYSDTDWRVECGGGYWEQVA